MLHPSLVGASSIFTAGLRSADNGSDRKHHQRLWCTHTVPRQLPDASEHDGLSDEDCGWEVARTGDQERRWWRQRRQRRCLQQQDIC